MFIFNEYIKKIKILVIYLVQAEYNYINSYLQRIKTIIQKSNILYNPVLWRNTGQGPKFDRNRKICYNKFVAFKGGNKFYMKNNDKASISLKKIVCISITLIFLLSVGVMAGNVKVRNVKIVLSSGYEMDILTTKTSVKDILNENHIVLLEDEKVTPDTTEELSDNNTIIISKESEEVEISENVEKSSEITTEEVLNNYSKIVEKIVVEEEKIPYETITKDVTTGSGAKQDRVVQNGQDGIKEVTYKVKYQNDKEIEKTKISSKVVKEPVDKIIEVRTKQVTTRGGSRTTYNGGKWTYSASELDLLCAITAQECNSSYEGALAVITTACNRTVSSSWRSYGSDPLSQYMAPNQFCYSIDSYWQRRLNGNYPSYVKQAVLDALNGKRNHTYLSFRAAGYASGEIIGGNVYFNSL